MFLKPKKEAKRLMLVLVTSISLIITSKKTVETTEIVKTIGAIRVGEDNRGNEYLETNLARVSYFRYLITFCKKSVLALFNLGNEINTIYFTFV